MTRSRFPAIALLLMVAALCTVPDAARTSENRRGESSTADAEEVGIRLCLDRLNEVMTYKNVDSAMCIWDEADDISLIGSDSGEVFIGRASVTKFFTMITRFSFTFSFDLDRVTIDHDGGIGWVFVDGKMVHHLKDGRLSKVPYRITGVMVKRGPAWRWKMFSGSIPRGE